MLQNFEKRMQTTDDDSEKEYNWKEKTLIHPFDQDRKWVDGNLSSLEKMLTGKATGQDDSSIKNKAVYEVRQDGADFNQLIKSEEGG